MKVKKELFRFISFFTIIGLFLLALSSCDDNDDNDVEDIIDDNDDIEMPATVIEFISESDDHETLLNAITEAGLFGSLSGDGPFTVFAPTDRAIGLLTPGTLNILLDETELLADILKYHVVESRYMSGDLTNGQNLTTLYGDDITVTIEGDEIYIENAKVETKDIETENGVVHVIDAVLVPDQFELPLPETVIDVTSNSYTHTIFDRILDETGLATELEKEGPFTVFAYTDNLLQPLLSDIEALLQDPQGDILLIASYLIVPGKYMADDLVDGLELKNLLDMTLTVTKEGNNLYLDGEPVRADNFEAKNGVVHSLNGLLLP